MPEETTQSQQSDRIQEVLTDASRTQFAAFSAAVTFWSAWAESAASYAKGMSDELTRISLGDTDTDQVLARMTDLGRGYLRELTELPTTAVAHFNQEIEKIEKHRTSASGKPAKPRRRAARAKP